jgi:rare lipoprotein A
MQRFLFVALALAALIFGAFASQASASSTTGKASYYKSGQITANGEPFKPMGMTAAHRKLKFGTRVRVTNLINGRKVIVRINDRGPFIKGRIIDLSLGAAKKIGMLRRGIARVKMEVLN